MKLSLPAFCLSLILIAFASSCNKGLPNGGKPYYLVIDSVVLDKEYSRVGTSSQKITDVWVQVQDKNLGVNEYPFVIPMLFDPGTYKAALQAGIRNNGISSDRRPYPFYATLIYDMRLDTTQFIHVTPHFHYITNSGFHVVNEDFEAGNFFDKGFVSFTGTPDVFEGSVSARMELAPSQFIMARTPPFHFTSTSICYVELNYKSDVPVGFGIEATQSGANIDIDKVTLFPTTQWTKVYVEFTPQLTQTSGSDSYKFYMKATNGDTLNTASVFLDNFKILNY
jgi:hypothetical protein